MVLKTLLILKPKLVPMINYVKIHNFKPFKLKLGSMINYVNAHTFEPSQGEVFTQVSQTIPNMSISLREMIDRHNRGGNVKVFTPVTVPDDSMVPVELERMSSIDKAQLSIELADFVISTRGKLITARKAAQKAAFDAHVASEAAKRVASFGSNASD